ncbi:type VI secretion system protein TssA [Azorhizobium doebereinerae]|uniref:type VI secretion system protein TssA n=1 Tax=Azorhizobium doebereinerae TaxID=281091 RepID=UPI0003FCE8BF|nr:type VI secretion system protein TssA [Azorhizobium doebereinerae]
MSDLSIAVFEDARCAALQAPLSANAPLGADVREDPAFEDIEAEVRLIDTEGPGGVRWGKVADGGLDLITHRGRDLLVVVWTIYALAQQERWRGIAVGFSALAPMVADHWDAILPKRERARVGALEWLTVRLTPLVAEMKPEADEASAVLHASAILEDLQRLLPEKLAKEQVAIGELVRAVRAKAGDAKDMLARAAAAEAEAAARATAASAAAEAAASAPPPAEPARAADAPAAPASATAPAAHVPPPAAAPPAPPAGGAGPDMERALSALADSMRQHAAVLRDADLADPRSYRLARMAAWLDITVPPEAKGGTTQLFPPGAQRLQSIEALHRAGEHEAVVRNLEAMIGSAPFWLDASRLVCDALALLGPRYGMAVGAVLETTTGFVRRLPELVDLTFSDGTPFADAATRDWLSQHAGAGAAVAADAPGEDLAELQGEVRELAANGRKAEALDRLAAARERARDGRQVFDIQALQAQLCLDMDLPGVALPLVVHLQAVADARTLDLWEPALALKAAGLAMRALKHPSAAKVLGEERLRTALEAAQQRLAHLDLRAAARFVHS